MFDKPNSNLLSKITKVKISVLPKYFGLPRSTQFRLKITTNNNTIYYTERFILSSESQEIKYKRVSV